jgi:hypothetical protein
MAVLCSNAALPVADCIVRDRYDIRSNKFYIFGCAGGSEELHCQHGVLGSVSASLWEGGHHFITPVTPTTNVGHIARRCSSLFIQLLPGPGDVV